MTQPLLPKHIANGSPERSAKVINISSVDEIWDSTSDTPSYIASKSGLIQLTKNLPLRLVDNNVVVSEIAPEAFASNLNRATRDTPEKLIYGISMKRIGT